MTKPIVTAEERLMNELHGLNKQADAVLCRQSQSQIDREAARREGWEACREMGIAAAKEAKLPDNYQWGADAMRSFNFGKERAAAAIASISYDEEPTGHREQSPLGTGEDGEQ